MRAILSTILSALLPSFALGLGGDLSGPSIAYKSGIPAAEKKKVDAIYTFMNEELTFLEGSFINQFTWQRFNGEPEKVVDFIRLLRNAGQWTVDVQFRDFGEQDSAFSVDQDSSSDYVRVMVNSGRKDFGLHHFKALLPKPQLPQWAKASAQQKGEEGMKQEFLYLHCFRPTFGMKVPPTKDRTPATPPMRVLSLRIHPGIEFEAKVGEHHHGIKGILTEEENGDLHATFEGAFGSSVHGFTGKVALDKPFDPDLRGFSSAVIPFRVVISANKDIEPFLKAQADLDAKKLAEATRITRENTRKGQKAEKQGIEGASDDPGEDAGGGGN